jgi:hypothetical protein
VLGWEFHHHAPESHVSPIRFISTSETSDRNYLAEFPA